MSPLPFFLFSLLIFHPPPATVAGQTLTLKKLNSTQNHTCFPQRSRTENGATILELHHRDYCSRPRVDWTRTLRKHILSDQIRVHSLQSRIKTALSSGFDQQLSQARIPLTSGAKLQTLNYIVTVGLGGRNKTLIVDTGSDLTWVQCQPCSSCYNQQEPLFNPLESPSYKSVVCESATCRNLEYATGSSGVCGFNDSSTCNYYVSYGDGSYTRGELASDNLVLGTTVVKGFVFGCGRVNEGLFGGASGLIGLGRSPLSMVSQTSDVFGGVFSYCLPSATGSGPGSLILGNGSVFANSSPVSYTKLLSNPMLSTFYFLNVTGISIGGVPLDDPSFGKREMLIDSGTVITRLSPSVYGVFKAEFVKQFSGFPKAPAFSILDTCFNLSTYEEVDIPTIKIQFENQAELNVDINGILYFAKADASQVCLALASLADEQEIGIIGNYQQKNTRVIYDTKASMLGFAKETCGSD